MKNILITGGAGFIGASLTKLLTKHNFEVTVLDNLSPQIHGANPEVTSSTLGQLKGNARLIVGSVTNPEDVKKAIEGQDAIVHFAAETGTGQSMYKIQQYVDVNIAGTGIILDILANTKHNVQKMVVASSRSIYGEGKYFSSELNAFVYPKHRSAQDMDKGDFEVKFHGVSTTLELVATDEESKIHPSSVYGITKQNQEQMVMTVCPTIGINPVAFRYQNVYGPGQSLSNPYTGILSIFSSLIRSGKGINIFEDGNESRDFVFIDDVVEATFAGLTNSRADGEVFNVGTGVPTNINAVARALTNGFGIDVPVTISGNYRLGDIRHNFASLEKIAAKLDFIPSYNFENGIQKFIDWVKSQEITSVKYRESIEEMEKKGLLKVSK